MVNIQLDEKTADILETRAREAGLPLSEYLKTVVAASSSSDRLDWQSLQRDIDALSFDGPPSSSFSRADIYCDHD
jgi:hypothetical protein